MPSDSKSITINPDFFKVGGRKGASVSMKRKSKQEKKQKNREKLLHRTISNKKNKKKLKNELLKRIQEYQRKQQNQTNALVEEHSSHVDLDKINKNEFEDAIDVLKKIIKQKRKQKAQTLKNRNNNSGILGVSQYTNPKTVTTNNTNTSIVNKESPINLIPSAQITQGTPEPLIQLRSKKNKTLKRSSERQDKPFGCLKNGNKPTYRTYMKKLRESKGKVKITNPMIQKPSNEVELRKHKLKRMQQKYNRKHIDTPVPMRLNRNPHTKKQKPKTRQRKWRVKTLKRKYKLGRNKHKKSVDVLIKNNESRKKVNNAIKALKDTNIHDVNRFLKTKHLIKTGSTAPEFVKREMYNSAMLAGDVTNTNTGVLIHNYMAKDNQ